MPAAERPQVGKLVTDAIAQFESLLEEARQDIGRRALEKDLQPGEARRHAAGTHAPAAGTGIR